MNPHIFSSQMNRKTKDQERIKELEAALTEIERISSLLIYQNNGRWNPEKEHEMRARNVVNTIREKASKVLNK